MRTKFKKMCNITAGFLPLHRAVGANNIAVIVATDPTHTVIAEASHSTRYGTAR